MNWIETVLIIKQKLSQHGLDDAVKRINDAQMVLGTPGEMYLEVMHELLSIRDNSPSEYILIQQEIEDLLEYGRALNYFPPRD